MTMNDNTATATATARRFSPDNGAAWYTADALPDEYWLAGHWAQIENLMEDRARIATERAGELGFDSFADCLAYYLRQAENDLILP